MRTSFSRVIAATAGMAALVGLLALGASNQFPWHSALVGALAGVQHGDYIDGGVRIVPPSPTSLAPESAEEGDGMTKTDLEGDEVSPALATYGIDGEGNLFEVHSPHTEVPRLAGPTL